MKRLGACAVLAVVAVAAVPGVGGAQSEAQEAVFADVAVDAYYYEPVQALAEMGVFEGTGCEEGFCPDRPLLRREMAVWLIRALGEDSDLTDDDSRFADVEDSWHVPYIERMADLEITVGCRKDPPRFCPDRSVSRSEMASFLARALDLPAAPSAGFTDVDHETNVHAKNIDKLAASEITVGCRTEPLRYCPARSTSRAHMATFIHRSLRWLEEDSRSRIVQDENPGVYLTEENDLSRLIREEIVRQYADEFPWLMEVWNYTNRPDFQYRNDKGSSVQREYVLGSGSSLHEVKAVYLSTGRTSMSSPEYGWWAIVHEIAHVYAGATPLASKPAPLAAAHLYFANLSQGVCSPGHELYADTAAELVSIGNNPSGAVYWQICPHLPSKPTEEAVTVVRDAFSGRMPQWFYDTFQKDDGSLDYEAIWSAVKALENDHYGTRVVVIHQLKDAFGGYCSNAAVREASFDDGSSLKQPWRDGGCS